MIKIVILDQSKPIYRYGKIKNSKIQNLLIACLLFIKTVNKTSIEPILKSNSTSFMINKKICKIKGKKVIHWGWPGGIGEPSKLLLVSVILVFTWISKYFTWISKQ